MQKTYVAISDFEAYIRRLARGQAHPRNCALYFVVDNRTEGLDLPVSLRDASHTTIVLQTMFSGMRDGGGGFSVELQFKGAPYRIRVPFEAVIHAWTLGAGLPPVTLEVVPRPAEGNVVRVDFQAKRRV